MVAVAAPLKPATAKDFRVLPGHRLPGKTLFEEDAVSLYTSPTNGFG